MLTLEAQGKLWFERLNSGSILALQGESKRRIRLCREGTSDFVVIQPDMRGRGCFVTFLELKNLKGKQSEAQREFQAVVGAQGCEYVIIKSIDDVMEILESK